MLLGAPLMIGLLVCAAVASLAVLFLATLEREVGRGTAAGFVAGWCVLVLLPLVWSVFGRGDTPVQAVGTYDFAGAAPFHLGVGVAACAVAVRTRDTLGRSFLERMPLARLSGLLVLLWLAWLVWLVLMELDVTQFSSRIILTSAIISATSLLAAVCVERLRTGRITRMGFVVGLVTGLAASTACCAFLEPLGAAVTGIMAGIAAVVLSTTRKGFRDTSLAAVIGVTNLTGGAVGLLTIGIFDSGRGFLYTGAPTLPVAQVVGVAGALLLAAIVTVPLALVVLRQKSPNLTRERQS